MPRNFKLTVAYDGTDYAGWQVQSNLPTIQQELELAIRRVTKQQVRVVGSGRTDAGVHALAQVANCQIPNWNASAAGLARGVNTLLPDTIVVNECEDAPDDFHAIRDAIGKRYRYQLQLGGPRDVFAYRYHYRLKFAVQIEPMIEAAKRLLGKQDFACFQAAGAKRVSTIRDIRHCDVLIDSPVDQEHEIPRGQNLESPGGQNLESPGGRNLESPGGRNHKWPGGSIPRIAIEVEADGFLYNMVRNIVGTLLEVGRGKQPPEWVDQLIAGKNRHLAGPTAPPQGLFLKRVDYEPFS